MESKGFRRESLVARSVRVAGCEISLKASRGYDLWHRSSLASVRFDNVAAYRESVSILASYSLFPIYRLLKLLKSEISVCENVDL